MHLCTQSMRDFVYVTLVFDDGKWVEAHKMILAACNCLCLEKLAPTSTDLYERNSEEYFKAFDLRGNDLMLGFSSIQNLYKIYAGSAFCDKNAICNLFLIKMTYFMIFIGILSETTLRKSIHNKDHFERYENKLTLQPFAKLFHKIDFFKGRLP